jgi:hypothetical protein
MTSSCLTWYQTPLSFLCYMLPLKPTGHLPPRNLGVSGPGILHLRGGLSRSSDSEACETPVNFVALLVRSAEFYLSPTGRFESSPVPVGPSRRFRGQRWEKHSGVWRWRRFRLASDGWFLSSGFAVCHGLQVSHGHVCRVCLCSRVMLRLENPGRSWSFLSEQSEKDCFPIRIFLQSCVVYESIGFISLACSLCFSTCCQVTKFRENRWVWPGPFLEFGLFFSSKFQIFHQNLSKFGGSWIFWSAELLYAACCLLLEPLVD